MSVFQDGNVKISINYNKQSVIKDWLEDEEHDLAEKTSEIEDIGVFMHFFEQRSYPEDAAVEAYNELKGKGYKAAQSDIIEKMYRFDK